MNNIVITILIILFSALIIFDILISILGYLRSKKHSRHVLSNGIMNRMADIMTGCPIEFVYKHSKLIPSSSAYRLEPADNDRIIIGHNLIPDPYYGDERMLTIFITNSSLFPYFLADESDLIDLVDARIHFREDLVIHNCDDDCVTAVDGHIEDSEDEPEKDSFIHSCDGDRATAVNLNSTFKEKRDEIDCLFGFEDNETK